MCYGPQGFANQQNSLYLSLLAGKYRENGLALDNLPTHREGHQTGTTDLQGVNSRAVLDRGCVFRVPVQRKTTPGVRSTIGERFPGRQRSAARRLSQQLHQPSLSGMSSGLARQRRSARHMLWAQGDK